MRRFIFVLAALLSAAPWAHAQPSGGLAGTVRTSEGTPVPNLVLIVRGRAEAGHLFRSLQNLRTGSIAPFDNILAEWSTSRGQGRVAVVISDLLLDEYRNGIRQMVGAGFAVTVLHVLSPQELEPEGQGELELLDSETGERLEVHLGQSALAEYKRRLETWRAESEEWCRNQGANYFFVRSDWEAERILVSTLRRAGITE
jgi:hypothetical protein